MKSELKKQLDHSGGPIYRVRMIYKNGNYAIREVVVIEKMNLLKSLELPKQENHVGSYIELRGKKGEIIYRTHYEDPSNPFVLVSNEDDTFSHLKSNLQVKHFEILIPIDTRASALHFFSSGDGKNFCEEVHQISITEIEKFINPKNGKK